MMHMDKSDAKRIADKLADRLSEPIPHFDASDFENPLTLLDILRLGLVLGSTIRRAYPDVQDRFPMPPELLAAFLAIPSDPNKLRTLLYEGLRKSDEDPTALEDEAEFISAGVLRRGARKEIKDAFRKAWPPGSPGSDRKIMADELPKLVERTERLRPFLVQLLGLKQQFPNKEWETLADFLSADHPRECTYLKFRIERLPKLVELPVFSKAKTSKSKARILADLLVGGDFDLHPRYARQKAEEARRRMHGKQRKRSPRLPA